MKSYLPAFIFGGLVITLILQGVLFANTSLQSQQLQKQLSVVSLKLDKLQTMSDDSASTLARLREEVDYNNTKLTSSQNVLYPTDQASLLSPQNLSKTLGTTVDTTTSGNPLPSNKKVRLTSNWKTANVYETPKPDSKITGAISQGKDYLVISKQPDWYHIQVDSKLSGWVLDQLVYETN